jgi:hypothetical protein
MQVLDFQGIMAAEFCSDPGRRENPCGLAPRMAVLPTKLSTTAVDCGGCAALDARGSADDAPFVYHRPS